MRNKDENKHRKGQETTIGKIIYGFLLFMPLFAIGVTCGYAIFNKNANQSYSAREITRNEMVNDTYSYIENETYTIQVTYISDENINKGFKGKFNFDFHAIASYIDNDLVKAVNLNNNQKIINVYKIIDGVLTYYSAVNYPEDEFTMQFIYHKYDNSNYDTYNYASQWKLFVNYYSTMKLDEVFYNAVDKVTESPLFSWAENSIIYTTTNNTCNALSITTPFIPLLMSYWLIISVIYFLYDIALMLVWLIHKKVHELQESL